tara:strand:+ start:4749 stop:4958 length:210 start_codon:yes stop_codon:yes gene_type:complete
MKRKIKTPTLSMIEKIASLDDEILISPTKKAQWVNMTKKQKMAMYRLYIKRLQDRLGGKRINKSGELLE